MRDDGASLVIGEVWQDRFEVALWADGFLAVSEVQGVGLGEWAQHWTGTHRVRRVFGLGGRGVVPKMQALADDVLGVPLHFLGRRAAYTNAAIDALPYDLPPHRVAALAAGADRWGPCIVVHLSDCISLDAVDGARRFVERLEFPRVDLDFGREQLLASKVGRDEARRRAARIGVEAVLGALVHELREHPALTEAQVVASGALARVPWTPASQIDTMAPELVVDGIWRLHASQPPEPKTYPLAVVDAPRTGGKIRLLRPQPSVVRDGAPKGRLLTMPAGFEEPRYAKPDAPRKLKLAAAAAQVPMAPREVLVTQHALSMDEDPEVAEVAKAGLRSLADPATPAALRDPTLPPELLGRLAMAYVDREDLMEAILLNPATPDEAFPSVARFAPASTAELIANNHLRLLQRPDLALCLEGNANVPRATVERVVDFLVREGHFIPSPLFQRSLRRLGVGTPE